MGFSQEGSSSKLIVMEVELTLKVDNNKNQSNCNYETVIFVSLTMLLTVYGAV